MFAFVKAAFAYKLAEFAAPKEALACSLAHESVLEPPPPVFACAKAALACAKAALACAKSKPAL